MMEDLTIPDFLKTKTAGSPIITDGAVAPAEDRSPGSLARRLGYPETDADIMARAELLGEIAKVEAEKQAEKDARFAAYKRWAAENPEIVKARRAMKRRRR